MPLVLSPSRFRSASIGLLALLCVGLVGCEAVKAAEPDSETVLQTMLQVQQDAWNKNDSAAYAAVFSDNADFINIRGQIFSSKQAITAVHSKIFAGPFKGSTINIVMRTFKLLASGIALVDTDQTVTGYAGLPPGIVPSSPGTLLTHFKYVAVKQADGSWIFTSGQNTSMLPN